MTPGLYQNSQTNQIMATEQRRASLRLASQRISFFGRCRYRLARKALSLADDVSIFDPDNDSRAMSEVMSITPG